MRSPSQDRGSTAQALTTAVWSRGSVADRPSMATSDILQNQDPGLWTQVSQQEDGSLMDPVQSSGQHTLEDVWWVELWWFSSSSHLNFLFSHECERNTVTHMHACKLKQGGRDKIPVWLWPLCALRFILYQSWLNWFTITRVAPPDIPEPIFRGDLKVCRKW